MSQIISQNELVKRAIEFIRQSLLDDPQKSLESLVDEAGMRYNLSPGDAEALEHLIKKLVS